MRQDLRHYKQESDNRLMLLCDNDIAVYWWPIPNRLRGSEGRWVCDQVPPTILTYHTLARPILPIPLPLFMVCVFLGPGGLEVIGIAMSVGYGTKPLLSLIQRHPP